MANHTKVSRRTIFDLKRPPRYVSVLGHRLKVRVCPYLEDDGQELSGAFDFDSMTIYLERGCNWRSVLLHEILHAAIRISGNGEGLTGVREESIVLALEHALSPILF